MAVALAENLTFSTVYLMVCIGRECKRADIILMRTGDITLAQPRNVDSVIADGRTLFWGGRFTALDHAAIRKAGRETAGMLVARAGWP